MFFLFLELGQGAKAEMPEEPGQGVPSRKRRGEGTRGPHMGPGHPRVTCMGHGDPLVS